METKQVNLTQEQLDEFERKRRAAGSGSSLVVVNFGGLAANTDYALNVGNLPANVQSACGVFTELTSEHGTQMFGDAIFFTAGFQFEGPGRKARVIGRYNFNKNVPRSGVAITLFW